MGDNVGPYHSQFFPDRGQGLVLNLLGQRQGSQKVGGIVREGLKLEPDLVVAEPVASRPGPSDGVLPFFDPLLRRAP